MRRSDFARTRAASAHVRRALNALLVAGTCAAAALAGTLV